MTVRQWVISLLLAFHLVAVTLAAIPRPVPSLPPSIPRPDRDPVAATLDGPMTGLAEYVNRWQRQMYRATSPARRLTRPYVSSGLSQNWRMFSNPPLRQRYLRIDFYVQRPGEPTMVYKRLVLPSQVEGQVRLTYPASDKAITILMGAFRRDLLDDDEAEPEDGDSGDARRLAPLVRHFASRFSREQALSRDLIQRMEIWAGDVPIPAPGDVPTFPAELRRDMLNRYRSALPSISTAVPMPVWTVERQADLSWVLVDAAQRP